MGNLVVAKPSFKEQMLQAREEAIVLTVNRLLSEKGFDAMTVDGVAASGCGRGDGLVGEAPIRGLRDAWEAVWRSMQRMLGGCVPGKEDEPGSGGTGEAARLAAGVGGWPWPDCYEASP